MSGPASRNGGISRSSTFAGTSVARASTVTPEHITSLGPVPAITFVSPPQLRNRSRAGSVDGTKSPGSGPNQSTFGDEHTVGHHDSQGKRARLTLNVNIGGLLLGYFPGSCRQAVAPGRTAVPRGGGADPIPLRAVLRVSRLVSLSKAVSDHFTPVAFCSWESSINSLTLPRKKCLGSVWPRSCSPSVGIRCSVE